MAVNIKDVAREAGVSIATVSRVINGSNKVKEETRIKVLRVIKKLGYKPMPSLRKTSNLNYTVGVLVPNLVGDHYNEMVMAIEDYVSSEGFELIVSIPKMLPESEKYVLDQFFKRKIDGVILCELYTGETYLKPFLRSGIPIVALDYNIEDISCDSVNLNNKQGAFLAMEHLYENGHRKILYIKGPKVSPASIEREKGILKFLKKHNEVDVFYSEIEGYEPEIGYEAVLRHLKKYGKNFTAIFAVNDWSATGALRALFEKGINVPEDISLIGFDDAPYSKYIVPPLTTIRQPRWEMGKTAAQLLIERIHNRGSNIPKNVILQPELVIRKSVKNISNHK